MWCFLLLCNIFLHYQSHEFIVTHATNRLFTRSQHVRNLSVVDQPEEAKILDKIDNRSIGIRMLQVGTCAITIGPNARRIKRRRDALVDIERSAAMRPAVERMIKSEISHAERTELGLSQDRVRRAWRYEIENITRICGRLCQWQSLEHSSAYFMQREEKSQTFVECLFVVRWWNRIGDLVGRFLMIGTELFDY